MSIDTSFLSEIDGYAQFGRGVAADYVGQSFDVYRLGAASDPTGILGPNSIIATNVNAQFLKAPPAKLDSELPGKTLLYQGKLDMTQYLPSDVFVQRYDSFRYEKLVMTCASNRPSPQFPVFASTPFFCTISRSDSNPQSTRVGRVPYSGSIQSFEAVLTLTNGVFGFTKPGSYVVPAVVPVGFVMDKLRDYPRNEGGAITPTDDTRRQTWTAFLPPLSGVTIQARDIIDEQLNGARYEVTGVMDVVSAVFGQFLTLQRLR